ncbi:hypothetical protein D9M71_769900 [compost metagenome]
MQAPQKNAPRQKNQAWGVRFTARRFGNSCGSDDSDGNPFAALQLRGAHAGEGTCQAQQHFIDVGFADRQRRGESQAIGLRRIEQQPFVQRGLDHGVG